MQGTPEQRRPVTQADLDEINAGLAREGIEPVRQPAPAAHVDVTILDVTIHDDTMASTPQRAAATTNQLISPALEQPAAPQQHKQPAVEQRAAENEQYLDRSVDPETLSIPLVLFPRLNRVIPQSETDYLGWSAFIDAVAPTPAPVVQNKKDVHYVITGKLQEAPLSKPAQSELHRAGKHAETGKARSNKHIASLGPPFLLDDDTVDGDVFDREAKLKALGIAALIYSSHSYGFGKMGGRVAVCLNRPYTPDEHKPLWYGISHLLGGGFDKTGRTLLQCYGIHARRSNDAPHKRVVLQGAALDAEAVIALGRRLMPAKKASSPAARHEHPPGQAAAIEQIHSAVEFLSGYLDEHPEVLADETVWMNNIARPFAHQAWRCPDQRDELERLLDELSQKAPGYDREENEQRFDRYIAEARERADGAGDGPRTIASFFWWVKGLGWDGTTCPVVAEMNRHYSAGFIGGKFRVARFDQHPKYPLQRRVEFLTKDDFTNGVINPRVEVPKFNKKGKPDGTQMAPRGKYWFYSSKRSEFHAVTFKPGAPPVTEKEQDGRIHKTLNTYAGFSVSPDHVDSAAKCSHYLAHIHDNIAGRDDELYKYILDWMASGVQHPEDPGRSALSLRGAPGCGKGVFVLGYGRLFGQHFLHATHREHVTGKFNAHQAETCLIFVDEALYAEIASDAQILKTMTSETTKLLERKGINSIQIDNFSRLVFATNEEHPIQIEHDDRRYPAIYVKENEAFANETDPVVKAEKRKAYFAPIIEQLDNGGKELLLDRDIRNFNAEAIPETAERKQQKLQSARAGDQVIIEFAQEGCLPGALNKRPWIARPHREFLHGPRGLLDEMKARGGQRLSRLSDHKLTDILKSWNFKRKSLGDSRGWEAPLLPELRAGILAKYPAVEFDDRTEWGIGEDGF